MKFSKQTIDILKNFAGINSNILIREGSQLRTCSPGVNIFAVANVPEEFPIEFAIYDLNSLLAILTLDTDQDVEFNEKSISISKGNGSFQYFYADASVIIAPPNKDIKVDPHFDFSLAAADVTMISKAANITGATTLSIIADGENAVLVVGDPKTDSSNSYRKILGETDLEFDCRLSIDNFKVMTDSYDVIISKQRFINLKSTTQDVQYFMSLDTDSQI